MKFFEKLKDLDLKNRITGFISDEDITELSFPSVVYFNGKDIDNQDVKVIMVDYDRVLEIWAGNKNTDKEFQEVNNLLRSETMCNYRIENYNLPLLWEDFREYVKFFLESGELEILCFNYIDERKSHEEVMFGFERSIKLLNLIREYSIDLLTNKKNIFQMDVVNSGKMIVFSIETNRYINLANKFETESEKKFLWFILNLIMKKKILKRFFNYKPAKVSKGMMGFSVLETDSEELKKSLYGLNEDLIYDEENVINLVKNNEYFMDKFSQYSEFVGMIKKETRMNYENVENMFLDYFVKQGDSFIENSIVLAEKLKEL